MNNLFLNILLNIILVSIGFNYKNKNRIDLSGFVSLVLIVSILIWTSNYSILAAVIVMFITSNAASKLSKYFNSNNYTIQSNDGPRDWKQAICNMGFTTVLAIAGYLTSDVIYLHIAFATIASATSDTWSSEIGIYSNQKPKYLISRRVVEPGISGGVTRLGSTAAFMGSLLISSIHYIIYENFTVFLIIFVIGFAGSFIDSFLGEFFQSLYLNENTSYTEIRYNQSKLIKGIHFISNNMVNFITSLIIVFISFLVFISYGH